MENEKLYSIFLGIVQGLTEFIPVSSSGHLVIFSWLFDGEPIPLIFNIALHFGTTLAVLCYFWRDWLQLTHGGLLMFANRSFSKDPRSKLLFQLFIASIPAGLIGLSCKSFIETHLHHPLVVVFPLAIVGILLWLVDKKSSSTHSISKLSNLQSFLIGIAQACALIPGVSRSGATILAGRWLHLDRHEAAKFSFLLGTPAMVAASLLHFKEFLAHPINSSFFIGIFSSLVTGVIAIHWFLKFIQNFGFFAFALYRCLLAVALSIIFLMTH